MGTQQTEDFNAIQFEKTLTSLKDSQDSINAACKWCLENRSQHKKIVISWLNVLKRVKIEQRLVLFYLANDVIQYSKRKHFDFVDSWGTALQKATTLVRDEKVKHKIVRIFNIWQQRGVYNEEFISDLVGLISVVPTASKSDESHEFQASHVINKIKQCSKLETETDVKLKALKEHNPKIQIETDSLCASLKDRAHVDDVEKELDTYVTHLEEYINALKAEIKCRIGNISVLKQAETQLEKDKKDVKVVANAYRMFGNKVKTFRKKLEEHCDNQSSPIPSPDVNAPSPSPEHDIDLPGDDVEPMKTDLSSFGLNFTAGYYNPVPPPAETAPNFNTNGYTSFIGANFALDAPLFSDSDVSQPKKPNNVAPKPPDTPAFPPYSSGGHLPLLPPPMPPFNPNDSNYSGQFGTNSSFNSATSNYSNNDFNSTNISDFSYSQQQQQQNNDEYNPEQELDNNWENDSSWPQQAPLDSETPESPPNFEKEGYVEGVEYHDNAANSGAADVDHRVLHNPNLDNVRGRGKDVDHRNLISLTGSPGGDAAAQTPNWRPPQDQDYRQVKVDQDYRMPPPFTIEQLKLPPPPPPPPAKRPPAKNSPRKQCQDNVESIDMDLSEDDAPDFNYQLLKPPPPLPDLPDDVDANSFLDDLDNDLNSNEFTANLHDPIAHRRPPPPPPPQQQQFNFNVPPPFMAHGGPPPGWRGGGPRGRGMNNGRGFGWNNGGMRGARAGFRGVSNFRRGFRGGPMRGMMKGRGNRGNFQGGY